MFSSLSGLRDFFFPADRLPMSGFPWKRGFFMTLCIMLAALVLTVVAPILVLIPLLAVKEALPGLFAALKADKLLFASVLQLVTYVAGFGASVWFLKSRFERGTSLKQITSMQSESFGGKWGKLIGQGILFLMGANLVTVLVYAVFHFPEPYSPAGAFGETLSGASFLIFAVCTVVLAPLFEELVFRGFFYNMLRASFGNSGIGEIAAVVVSAAIFAGVHGTLTGFPPLFITGMALALIYRRTGSLYGSMTLHALNNLMATVALFLSMHH